VARCAIAASASRISSAAVGALSGPLHGGAPCRVLKMLDDVEREGDAERYVKALLDRAPRAGRRTSSSRSASSG
jgi:citrate synthase